MFHPPPLSHFSPSLPQGQGCKEKIEYLKIQGGLIKHTALAPFVCVCAWVSRASPPISFVPPRQIFALDIFIGGAQPTFPHPRSCKPQTRIPHLFFPPRLRPESLPWTPFGPEKPTLHVQGETPSVRILHQFLYIQQYILYTPSPMTYLSQIIPPLALGKIIPSHLAPTSHWATTGKDQIFPLLSKTETVTILPPWKSNNGPT